MGDIYLTLVGGNIPTIQRGELLHGSTCLILFGGTVTPVTQTDNEVLLTYDFRFSPGIGNCPIDAQFRLAAGDYELMRQDTKQIDEVFIRQVENFDAVDGKDAERFFICGAGRAEPLVSQLVLLAVRGCHRS
ncbi:hypothetical protein ACLKOZ_19755 [Arthrobacter sp. R4]|uniref:hypothetical protein n=1 Tax=Arthrobacter sp. R4 TaxID=644417 RepID=UPI003EDB13AF